MDPHLAKQLPKELCKGGVQPLGGAKHTSRIWHESCIEFSPMSAKPFSLEEYEKIQPTATLQAGGEKVHYAIPNKQTLWRVETLHQKEPDTMAWISQFAAGEIMVDIGANVGMYTIWAAKTRGVKVYAFEPESQNYALLNRNIFSNQLSDRVQAYCIALSDVTGYSQLHLSNFVPGGSCHALNEKLNFKLEPFSPKFSQACYSTTLDSLIEQEVLPVPHYIKIDVDGIEHKVIEGCTRTLMRPGVKAVLVELNTHLPIHMKIVERMRRAGFGINQEQVRASLQPSGAFEGIGNYIFQRDLA
jgi:FkbM family methyltransferase